MTLVASGSVTCTNERSEEKRWRNHLLLRVCLIKDDGNCQRHRNQTIDAEKFRSISLSFCRNGRLSGETSPCLDHSVRMAQVRRPTQEMPAAPRPMTRTIHPLHPNAAVHNEQYPSSNGFSSQHHHPHDAPMSESTSQSRQYARSINQSQVGISHRVAIAR